MTLYEKAWQDVHRRIAAAAKAAGRDPAQIALLAVSKSLPSEAVRAAYALGQRAFGENYVQEATAKMRALADLPDLEWHLIGPLQRNKTHLAGEAFGWIETIARLDIAERLSAARNAMPPLGVCIQVNISAEPRKSGVSPDAALELAREVSRLPALEL